MRRGFLPILTAGIIGMPAAAQVRVVNYNIADLAGDHAALTAVFAEASADDSHGFASPVTIYLFQEVDENDIGTIGKLLGPEYTMGTFTDQNDSSWGGAQAMYYRSDQVIEHTASHADIYTYASRHADRWRLDLLGYENQSIWVYSMHLKSSTGSSNQETRRAGAENVRDDIMTLPGGSHVIVAGDMNFYSPSEPGYVWFTDPGDGQVIDPLGSGSWSGSSNAIKHTQSPLATSAGGLIGGGLDDRFDFQFLSANMLDGDGLSAIDGTYRSLGNDGQHYNDAINTGNNTYFPLDTVRSNALADDLIVASDHLPLIADYQIPAVLSWDATGVPARLIIGSAASASISVSNDADVVVAEGADTLDVLMEAAGDMSGSASHAIPALSAPIVELFDLDTSVSGLWTGTLTLTATSDGTQPAPEVVELEGAVLDHANPSFSGSEDLDWAIIECAYEAGEGVQTCTVPLFNRGFNAYQSLLDVDAIGTPDPPITFAGISTNQVGSIPGVLSFDIDTDAVLPGVYESSIPLDSSDEDLPGEAGHVSMLVVRIEITGAATCLGDIAGSKAGGDGVVDIHDLLMVIADWGEAGGGADMAPDGGDGIVDIHDLLALIGAWGPCP